MGRIIGRAGPRTNDLGNDDIRKLVLRLAIPSMLAQFVSVFYSIVDRMYIGNIPEIGEAALAGAGVCGPVVSLISSFAFLVGIGGAPLLAMRMGEGNQEGAEVILANCFVMLLVLAGVLTSFFLLFKQPLLMWFGASPQIYPYANSYMTVYVLGTVFAILSAGLNQFIICQGFSTLGMLTVLIGAILNILLDPLFIFTFRLDVMGAALATVVSQAASAGFVLYVLLGKKLPVGITFGQYSMKIVKRVLTFGFSPFVIIATDSIILIVLNGVLQKYGGAEQGDMLVTCATIVQSYMLLITMPLGGITSGTQPILSFNYGAKKSDRIRKGVRSIVWLCILFIGVMALLTQLIPVYFVQIFTKDPDYIQMSVWGIRVFTMGLFALAFQYPLVDAMTALGIAKVAITLSLFRKTSFMVFTVVLPIFFGATGAFFAEPIADVLGGTVSTVTFLLLINKLLKKREEMPDGQALYS